MPKFRMYGLVELAPHNLEVTVMKPYKFFTKWGAKREMKWWNSIPLSAHGSHPYVTQWVKLP